MGIWPQKSPGNSSAYATTSTATVAASLYTTNASTSTSTRAPHIDIKSAVPLAKPGLHVVPRSQVDEKTESVAVAPGHAGVYCHNSGSNGAMKAKRLDIDFDFDSIENSGNQQVGGFSDLGINASSTPAAVSPNSVWGKSPKGSSTPVSPVQWKSSQSINCSSPTTCDGSNSRTTNPSLSRYHSSKAISSEQFFGGTNTAARFNPGEVSERFGSNTAISSGTLFGNQSRKETFEDVAAAKLEVLKDSAKEGISYITSAGSEYVNRIGSWMSSS